MAASRGPRRDDPPPVGSSRGPVAWLPRLRVTVTCSGPDHTGLHRWALDTERLPQDSARRLHALVDAVEATRTPAGRGVPPAADGRPGEAVYDVVVARGYGHWTVRVSEHGATPALAALIDHVRGAPDRS